MIPIGQSFQDDLNFLQQKLFDLAGFKVSAVEKEIESGEYHAGSFKLNKKHILYRLAKITPTKTGQFVTVWKRKLDGPIQPFDQLDDMDFVMVMAKSKTRFGAFVFPKAVLVKQGVFSKNSKGGKRAIRVYPSWDKAESKQAERSQAWQLNYFVEISNKESDTKKIKTLFGL